MTGDPLPSWNEGPVKQAILDFVARVTAEDGPDFVPPTERIATFDNDGTLWCEYPLQIQVFFAQQRLHELAAADPSMRQRQPYKAFLEHDVATIHAMGKEAVFDIAFTTHAGMSTEAFADLVADWFAHAKHPQLGRRFVECTFLPQRELLDYLRANGFRTFIVSGGGIDFMRAITEQAYGIPPEQVVGSSVKLRFELQDGRGMLVKTAELGSFDDREVKPANIGLHIGRRPIFVFGNSDGDLAMLRYALTGDGPRLGLLLHHDDAEREFAYDREFHLSPLAEALDKANAYGITLVSMKDAWRTVFAPPSA
ncbi:haloacid dehalogenase [Sphingomonas sp. DBB INV C78]|uniref:HAD family hydrolase n=1 Tax=Sphingomonas sp. DBB INV C78 TaxID=3349434 RepID=UPI0036D35FCB